MSESVQNDEQGTPEDAPTLEQWRDLGNAEANAWTITPLGGRAMSLDELAEYNRQQEQERQEHLRIYAEEEESEARRRAAQAQAGENA